MSADTETLYHVRLMCSACGSEIDRTKEISLSTLRKDWTLIALGSAFGHRCSECRYSTGSDFNIRTTLGIYTGDTPVDKEILR